MRKRGWLSYVPAGGTYADGTDGANAEAFVTKPDLPVRLARPGITHRRILRA